MVIWGLQMTPYPSLGFIAKAKPGLNQNLTPAIVMSEKDEAFGHFVDEHFFRPGWMTITTSFLSIPG
jgi:hypothetical protein